MHATDKTGMQQHASQCQSQGGCLTDDACTSQREPDCLDLGHRLGVSKLAMYSMACAGPTCYAAPYNPPPSTSGVPALHSQHTWAVMSSGILSLALVSSFVCFMSSAVQCRLPRTMQCLGRLVLRLAALTLVMGLLRWSGSLVSYSPVK